MSLASVQDKIQPLATATETVADWRAAGQTVVFTNGCFDLLHYGHLHYLAGARALGHRLVVGLNSADSVRRLKGAHRPINDEPTRQTTLAALQFVDLVVVFGADTPLALIEALRPDVLVKGGDYMVTTIVGAETVQAYGGQVRVLPFVDGYSSTNIEQRIKNA